MTARAALVAGSLACAAVASAGPPGDAASDLRAEATVLAREVERMRGLAFRGPVETRLADRDAILADVRQHLGRDHPPARLRDLSLALAAFGLLPRGFDLQRAHLGLFADGVAGFYDARLRRLTVPDWTDPGTRAQTIFHELVHALQDQHYDLDGLVRPDRYHDDAAWAHTALAEGEAVLLTAAWRAATGDAVESPEMLGPAMRARLEARAAAGGAFGAAPPVLREQMIFPYAEGTAFVAEAWRRHGPGVLGLVFFDPPASTEQILHPEKYFDRRDPPTTLASPDLQAALPGWRCLERNVAGEQVLRVRLAAAVGPLKARAAAAGWDGLAFSAWEGPRGEVCLAFASVWDTPEDAAEFADAWREAAAQLDPGALWPEALTERPAPAELVREREAVFAVLGAPPAAADNCMVRTRAVERRRDPRDPWPRAEGSGDGR